MSVSSGLEPFPARTALKRALDYLMYGVALFAPLVLLPQIIQLYSSKSSAGLSLVTWLLLTLVNVMWATYAVVHKDKHILFANILMALFNITIVAGILLYR